MSKTTIKPVLSVLCGALALSACTMIPKYQQPTANVAQTFKHDTAAGNGIQTAQLGWRDYFADPRLQRLIELALAGNTDLRTAALNAEAVRAQYMISRASLLPGLNATGSGSRSGSNNAVSSAYSVGLGVTGYELDLFGRVRSNNEAALQSYFSTVAARDAAQLSLIASVAKAYFNQRYAEESMKLAQNVLATREKTYKLSQLRHSVGVISAVDLRQQEALIESAKASYAGSVQTREQAENALALLLNRPVPKDLPAGLPLDRQFKISRLPAGLSSDVLLNRPDIQQAEFALKQANANIGAARAAFFPTISLTSTIGTGSAELSGLFGGGSRVWTFAPSITLPIFNWGSNQANLDYAKIKQQASVAAYEGAVQSAFQDISNALVAREQLEKVYAANAKQSKAYADYLRLINMRYKQGVSSALDLQDAERSSYGAEATLLATRLTLLENMADLYKALGGGLKQYTNEAQ